MAETTSNRDARIVSATLAVVCAMCCGYAVASGSAGVAAVSAFASGLNLKDIWEPSHG